MVGGEGLWNVHVHVDDVGAAIEAGIDGRPARTGSGSPTSPSRSPTRRRVGPTRIGPAGIVAVAAGPGLAELFEEAGAVVVRGGPGRPALDRHAARGDRVAPAPPRWSCCPTTPTRCGPPQVAARTAEEDHGIRVAVIPTEAQVQGLAALAVHEPGRTFDQDVLEMTATARHARHGAVTSPPGRR